MRPLDPIVRVKCGRSFHEVQSVRLPGLAGSVFGAHVDKVSVQTNDATFLHFKGNELWDVLVPNVKFLGLESERVVFGVEEKACGRFFAEFVRARESKQAAVFYRGVFDRYPEAADGERGRVEEGAVLVRVHLASNMWLLEDVH